MTEELVPKTVTAAALFVENGLNPILNEIKVLVDGLLRTLKPQQDGKKSLLSRTKLSGQKC